MARLKTIWRAVPSKHRAVLGLIACGGVFLVSLGVLVSRVLQCKLDTGANYFGMPVGPLIWSIAGVAASAGWAIGIWQTQFGHPPDKARGRHAKEPPVDLTDWKKW